MVQQLYLHLNIFGLKIELQHFRFEYIQKLQFLKKLRIQFTKNYQTT